MCGFSPKPSFLQGRTVRYEVGSTCPSSAGNQLPYFHREDASCDCSEGTCCSGDLWRCDSVTKQKNSFISNSVLVNISCGYIRSSYLYKWNLNAPHSFCTFFKLIHLKWWADINTLSLSQKFERRIPLYSEMC